MRRVSSEPMTFETITKIHTLLKTGALNQHEIASIVGVNSARVSEVLDGTALERLGRRIKRLKRRKQ